MVTGPFSCKTASAYRTFRILTILQTIAEKACFLPIISRSLEHFIHADASSSASGTPNHEDLQDCITISLWRLLQKHTFMTRRTTQLSCFKPPQWDATKYAICQPNGVQAQSMNVSTDALIRSLNSSDDMDLLGSWFSDDEMDEYDDFDLHVR